MAAIAPPRVVLLDAPATPTTLTRLRARAPGGQRAMSRVPHQRGERVPVVASITTAGMGAARLRTGALAHWRTGALAHWRTGAGEF